MKDEVYQILKEWIITGEYEPGKQLRDQDLSEILGISRTPIREALLRLENDGLVITKANRWTLVSPVDIDETENVYSIVWTLESLAMEQAFANITTADIEDLEQLNDRLKDAMETGNKLNTVEADNDFHDKIIKLSNNPPLEKVLSSLKLNIQRIEIHYFTQIDKKYTSYVEHQEIIKAIKNTNKKQAIQAIKANWENSFARIRINYD